MADDDEEDDNLRLLNPPSWWPQLIDRNAIFRVSEVVNRPKKPSALRICIECREWFSSKKKRKFCSSKCQQRAWRKKNPDQYQRIMKKYRAKPEVKKAAVKRTIKYHATPKGRAIKRKHDRKRKKR